MFEYVIMSMLWHLLKMDILNKLELKQLSKEEIENIVELDLNGKRIKKIPECLSHLTNFKLQELYLRFNQITLIPKCLGLMTNLQTLIYRNFILIIIK